MSTTEKQVKYNPLALLDVSLNKQVVVVLKKQTEYRGLLRGFDTLQNLMLENVKEYDETLNCVGDYSSMLLHGSHIAFIVPIGEEESA